MKRLCTTLAILLVCSWGCKTNAPDMVNPIVEECAGSSEYFINNQSRYDLTAEFIFSAEMGGKADSLRVIPSGQLKRVGHDGIFGGIPRPTNTFARLTLYRTVDGKPAVAYTQNPIVNEQWKKVKQNATDPDQGCYAVTNTLTITDQDVK